MKLTTPVRLELRRLQEIWQDWSRAYFQNDEEQARNALLQLQTITSRLGMSKLPDLSIASAAFAVRSAEEGNFGRARWAVDCARELDPGRPEADFAGAKVERLAGNYLGALKDSFEGYSKLLRLPLEGRIWRQNAGVWALYLLLVSGAVYLLIQMCHRGADLFHDLGRLVSPPLGRGAADAVAALLLIWPLALPSGVLWLALYWSILLWGYGTASQRGVLIFLWVVLGLTPFPIAYQQSEIQKALLPPARAIENIKTGRLYGGLFLDLEVLRDLIQDSTVVNELVADLHRKFGQWEHARLIYHGMIEDAPESKLIAPALNNIGVYHHRRGDYGTAVNFFTEAIRVAPALTEAHYNLSQAHTENFNFTEAHQALAFAKRLDGDRVARWEGSEGGAEGNVIPINGGLRRAEEIQQALDLAGRESVSESLVPRRYLSLAAALAAVVLAVALHLLRRQKGFPSSKFTGRPASEDNRWLLGLLPGWASTVEGQGVKAFLAISLPAGLVLVPMLKFWGYRAPLGYDAGPGLITILCIAGFLTFLGVRLLVTLRTSDSEP